MKSVSNTLALLQISEHDMRRGWLGGGGSGGSGGGGGRGAKKLEEDRGRKIYLSASLYGAKPNKRCLDSQTWIFHNRNGIEEVKLGTAV